MSHDADISYYKYVVYGDKTTGDGHLDNIIMEVKNQIAQTNLDVITKNDILKSDYLSGGILTPNIHVTSENWDGGHTYITVTFYDIYTNKSVVVVQSSGIGMTLSHDQSITLGAIKKQLKKLFGTKQ